MNTVYRALTLTLIALVCSSCSSLTGRVPATQLEKQLKMKIESVTVTDNKAQIAGVLQASKTSIYIEDKIIEPSLLITEVRKGKVDELTPILISWSDEDIQYSQKRRKLSGGEHNKFRVSIQLAEELSDRNRVYGKLYLSDDDGISGYLLDPNSEFQMKLRWSLSDTKNRCFVLTADKELLFTIVNGQLDVDLVD